MQLDAPFLTLDALTESERSLFLRIMDDLLDDAAEMEKAPHTIINALMAVAISVAMLKTDPAQVHRILHTLLEGQLNYMVIGETEPILYSYHRNGRR